jgi:hypothetical protein
MQPITFPQIDGCHPRPSTSVIALVISLDGLLPESAYIFCAILAKTYINQEVAKVEIRLEIRSLFVGCPGVDGACAGRKAIPAPEFSRAFRLIVHGSSKGDNAFDLGENRQVEAASGKIVLGLQMKGKEGGFGGGGWGGGVRPQYYN